MHVLGQAARFFGYVVLPFLVGAIVFIAILAALGMARVSLG
jgi:hypothetical protein